MALQISTSSPCWFNLLPFMSGLLKYWNGGDLFSIVSTMGIVSFLAFQKFIVVLSLYIFVQLLLVSSIILLSYSSGSFNSPLMSHYTSLLLFLKSITSSISVILYKSLVFYKVVAVASNFICVVTRTFSMILVSLKLKPKNQTQFSMLRSRSKYSIVVSLSYMLCNSKSHTTFKTCIP